MLQCWTRSTATSWRSEAYCQSVYYCTICNRGLPLLWIVNGWLSKKPTAAYHKQIVSCGRTGRFGEVQGAFCEAPPAACGAKRLNIEGWAGLGVKRAVWIGFGWWFSESFFSIPPCDVHPHWILTRRLKVVTTTYDAMREAIELLTQCFVLVQGQTVSIMGSVKGIKQAGLKYQRHADMLGIFRDIVDSLEIKIVLKWLWLVEMVSIAGAKNNGGLLSQHPSESSSDCELVVRYLPSSTILIPATHDANVYQVKDDGPATFKHLVLLSCVALNVKQSNNNMEPQSLIFLRKHMHFQGRTKTWMRHFQRF